MTDPIGRGPWMGHGYWVDSGSTQAAPKSGRRLLPIGKFSWGEIFGYLWTTKPMEKMKVLDF